MKPVTVWYTTSVNATDTVARKTIEEKQMVVKTVVEAQDILTKPGKASKEKIGKRKQAFLASFKLTTHHMMVMKVSLLDQLNVLFTLKKS